MITLINPPYIYSRSATSRFTVPPIGLAYIAAAIQQAQYSVHVIDSVGGWIDQYYSLFVGGHSYTVHGATVDQIVTAINPDTKVVGLTCTFSHCWPNVRDIIAAIKKIIPDITIIVGGEHPSSLPVQSLDESEADVIFIGEGESSIVAWLEAFVSGKEIDTVQGIAYRELDGKIVTTDRRPRIENINLIAEPAWHLFPIQHYMDLAVFHGPSLGVSMPIMATRGCPYDCTFCTSPAMWTTKWEAREPELVLEEMEKYRLDYGATDFQFVDLTFIIQRKWISQFCDLILDKNWDDVRWQLPSGTRSEVIDYELAQKLFVSGCLNVSFAPESGSKRILKRIKKKVNLSRLEQSARDCTKAGIKVECFFIVGFPTERLSDVLRTFYFMARLAVLGIHGASIATYRALPGTEMSHNLEQSGQLAYSDAVYMGILRSNDFWGSVSWNPAIPGWLLDVLRLTGHTIFYSISFGLRPARLIRHIRNLHHGIQETKLDRLLQTRK